MDDGIVTSDPQSIDMTAECVQSGIESTDVNEVDKEEHATMPSFSEAVGALDVVREPLWIRGQPQGNQTICEGHCLVTSLEEASILHQRFL